MSRQRFRSAIIQYKIDYNGWIELVVNVDYQPDFKLWSRITVWQFIISYCSCTPGLHSARQRQQNLFELYGDV